jgi:A/G-specific adenine glycosylase
VALKIKSDISRRLLKWFKAHGRDLPWRSGFSPYTVWVSEIMLQQTQVETVIPYYRRFLSSFPTLQLLAKAPQDLVLKQWEGLGYYSRARNLHRAAQQVVEGFNGRFPDQMDALITLPGIGKSTAGAILSLAYNQPFPILDGNVKRILTRLFALQALPGAGLDKILWAYSASLVPKEARSFNSALMDLGATVCRPRNPVCEICPLKSHCKGFEHNLQELLPLKKKRGPLPLRVQSALVIWKNKRVFIRKRPVKGLLGGLWEFPEEAIKDAHLTGGNKLLEVYQNLGFQVKAGEAILKIRQTFTHFKMELHIFNAEYHSGSPPRDKNFRWVSLAELKEFPFSASHKKIVEALLG